MFNLKLCRLEAISPSVAVSAARAGRPAIAYMVTPDKERRYVGGAIINLTDKMRERLWARVKAGAKPVKGVEAKPGTEWLKPGLIGRVRHLKGEETLRHASLQEVEDRRRSSVLRMTRSLAASKPPLT